MKEFTVGTDRQYEMLEESLEDGMCHVYLCTLPQSCSKSEARIGFEKTKVSHAVFIDMGITCNHPQASDLFQTWLRTGTLHFLDFDSIKIFFKSLKVLY